MEGERDGERERRGEKGERASERASERAREGEREISFLLSSVLDLLLPTHKQSSVSLPPFLPPYDMTHGCPQSRRKHLRQKTAASAKGAAERLGEFVSSVWRGQASGAPE
jgi:hypothetical protein